MPKKIAVFVSGRGSNFAALQAALKKNEEKAEIVCVVANRECPALILAKDWNIETFLVSVINKENFLTYEELNQKLIDLRVDLIVLAGFLKKIPDFIIDNFKRKIINIHPALLPSFGGKGMFGMNVHSAVFNSGAKVSGVTIHFVDKLYDHGEIIAQRCADISQARSPEEIAETVLQLEHKLLPETVLKIVEGKIEFLDNRIILH